MKAPGLAFHPLITHAFGRRFHQILSFLLLASHFRTAVAASAHQIPTRCVKVQCFDGSIHDCNFDCRSLVRHDDDFSASNETLSLLPQLRQRYQETRMSILQVLQAADDEWAASVARELPEEKTAISLWELDRAISELITYVAMDIGRFEIPDYRAQEQEKWRRVYALSLALPSLAEQAATATKEAELVRRKAVLAQRRFDRLYRYCKDTAQDVRGITARVYKRIGRSRIQLWLAPSPQQLPLEEKRERVVERARPTPRPLPPAGLVFNYSSNPTEATAQAKVAQLEKTTADLKAAVRRFIEFGGSRESFRSQRRINVAISKLIDLESETNLKTYRLAEARRTIDRLRDRYLPAIADDIDRLRREVSSRLPSWAMWKFFDETTAALLKASEARDPEAIGRLRKVGKEVDAFAWDEWEYVRAVPAAVVGHPQDIERLETLISKRVCTFEENVDSEAFPLPSWMPKITTCQN